MPADDRPQRVLVTGVSGVGKTTLARRLALILDAPHTEIDSLYHGENWMPRPGFLDDVRELAARDAWITEWQYREARQLLLDRAQMLVWLDLPRLVSLRRVVWRTWRRSRSRAELWNGNREPGMLHAVFATEGVIRWAVTTYRRYPERVADARRTHPGVVVVRLRSQRDVEEWLGRLADRSG